MPRCVVTCKVRFAVSSPIFHLRLRFSKLTLECRSLVNAALIQASARVPVSAPCTRTAFAKREEAQRESKTGEIADKGAVDWDHISRRAVDIQSTTRVGADRGPDIRRSAGFQVGEVISMIGRLESSQSIGTLESKKRFGPAATSGMKMDSRSIPSGRCGSHGSSQAPYP